MTITRTTSVQNGRATAQATIPETLPGTYPIDATYQQTNTHKTGEGTGQLVVQRYPTTTTLTSSGTQKTVGDVVIFTINVTSNNGTPTGDVRIYTTYPDGPTSYETVTLSNGTATYRYTETTANTYTINAVYQGSTYYNTSTSTSTSVTFNRINTTFSNTQQNITGLELGDNAQITGTLTYTGNLGGQIPFNGRTINLKTGNTTVATATTNDNGEFTIDYTTTLQNATYYLQYDGSSWYNPATSNNFTITCYRPHTITPTLNRGCIQPNGIVVLTFQDRNDNLLTNYSGTATIGQNTQTFTTNNNGQATIQFTELQTVGDYTLQINNTQEYYSTSIPLSVRHDVIISVPDVTVNQGETAVITATLNDENQTPVTSGQVEWTITEIQED